MDNLLWTHSKRGGKIGIFLVAVAAAIWVLVPFLWAVINSFKTLEATFSAGAIIPFLNFQPTLDSWKEVLDDPQSINSLMSSAIVAAGTTLLVLVLGTICKVCLCSSVGIRSEVMDLGLIGLVAIDD